MTNFRTNIETIDTLLGFKDERQDNNPFKAGDIIIIRGGPGSGKTTLGLQILSQFLQKDAEEQENGRSAIFISLESNPMGIINQVITGFNFFEKGVSNLHCLSSKEIEILFELKTSSVLKEISKETIFSGIRIISAVLAKEKLPGSEDTLNVIGEKLHDLFKDLKKSIKSKKYYRDLVNGNFSSVRKAQTVKTIPIKGLIFIDSLNALLLIAKQKIGINKIGDDPRLIINRLCETLRENFKEYVIICSSEFHNLETWQASGMSESFICDAEIVLQSEPIAVPVDYESNRPGSVGYSIFKMLDRTASADNSQLESRSFVRITKLRNGANQSRRCAYDIVSGKGMCFYDTYPGDGHMLLFNENTPQEKIWIKFFKEDVPHLYPTLRYETFGRSSLQNTFSIQRHFNYIPKQTDLYLSSFDNFWISWYNELNWKWAIIKILQKVRSEYLEKNAVVAYIPQAAGFKAIRLIIYKSLPLILNKICFWNRLFKSSKRRKDNDNKSELNNLFINLLLKITRRILPDSIRNEFKAIENIRNFINKDKTISKEIKLYMSDKLEIELLKPEHEIEIRDKNIKIRYSKAVNTIREYMNKIDNVKNELLIKKIILNMLMTDSRSLDTVETDINKSETLYNSYLEAVKSIEAFINDNKKNDNKINNLIIKILMFDNNRTETYKNNKEENLFRKYFIAINYSGGNINGDEIIEPNVKLFIKNIIMLNSANKDKAKNIIDERSFKKYLTTINQVVNYITKNDNINVEIKSVIKEKLKVDYKKSWPSSDEIESISRIFILYSTSIKKITEYINNKIDICLPVKILVENKLKLKIQKKEPLRKQINKNISIQREYSEALILILKYMDKNKKISEKIKKIINRKLFLDLAEMGSLSSDMKPLAEIDAKFFTAVNLIHEFMNKKKEVSNAITKTIISKLEPFIKNPDKKQKKLEIDQKVTEIKNKLTLRKTLLCLQCVIGWTWVNKYIELAIKEEQEYFKECFIYLMLNLKYFRENELKNPADYGVPPSEFINFEDKDIEKAIIICRKFRKILSAGGSRSIIICRENDIHSAVVEEIKSEEKIEISNLFKKIIKKLQRINLEKSGIEECIWRKNIRSYLENDMLPSLIDNLNNGVSGKMNGFFSSVLDTKVRERKSFIDEIKDNLNLKDKLDTLLLLAKVSNGIIMSFDTFSLLHEIPEERIKLFGERNSSIIYELDTSRGEDGRPISRPDTLFSIKKAKKYISIPYDANIGVFVARLDILNYFKKLLIGKTKQQYINKIKNLYEFEKFAIESGYAKKNKVIRNKIDSGTSMIIDKLIKNSLKEKFLINTWEELIVLIDICSQKSGKDKHFHFLMETQSDSSFYSAFLEIIWNCGGDFAVLSSYKIDEEGPTKKLLFKALLIFGLMFRFGIIPYDSTYNLDYFTEKYNKTDKELHNDWVFARHWYSTLIDVLSARKPNDQYSTDKARKPFDFYWENKDASLELMPFPVSLDYYLDCERKKKPVERYCCWGDWHFGISNGSENVALGIDLINNLMSSQRICERAEEGACLPTVEAFYELYGDNKCVKVFGRPEEMLPTKTYNYLRKEYFNKGKSRSQIFDYQHCIQEIDSLLKFVYTNKDEFEIRFTSKSQEFFQKLAVKIDTAISNIGKFKTKGMQANL